MAHKIVILVVEDEREIRDLARRTLVQHGYFVLTAPDADTALKFMRIVVIDVLFTDIVLPSGMNGFQLARLALSINPAIKVICTSGFDWVRENPWDSCRAMLWKPYEPSRLVAEVERALSA